MLENEIAASKILPDVTVWWNKSDGTIDSFGTTVLVQMIVLLSIIYFSNLKVNVSKRNPLSKKTTTTENTFDI